jgi:hypothetical protein
VRNNILHRPGGSGRDQSVLIGLGQGTDKLAEPPAGLGIDTKEVGHGSSQALYEIVCQVRGRSKTTPKSKHAGPVSCGEDPPHPRVSKWITCATSPRAWLMARRVGLADRFAVTREETRGRQARCAHDWHIIYRDVDTLNADKSLRAARRRVQGPSDRLWPWHIDGTSAAIRWCPPSSAHPR